MQQLDAGVIRLAEPTDDIVVIGRVVAVYGIKGWVKIQSYTDPAERITKLHGCYISPDKQQHNQCQLENLQQQRKALLAKFPGYDDPVTAAQLLQTEILIARQNLPRLPETEYYWHDLIGLTVFEINEQRILGTVAQLIATGANDVLDIREAEQQYLIPYIWQQVVKSVDLTAGTIKIDWPWLAQD